MGKTIYYTATTLDGFIATEDNSLDWLFVRAIDQGGPYGLDPFLAEVGALAMGATTYEWILKHSDEPWAYQQPAWVFTHRDLPRTDGDIRFVQGDVAQVHADMVEAAGDKNVWLVGGGELVGQFADLGLLDQVVAAVAPLTLGAGAPLLARHVELVITDVARNGDFACLVYDVVKPTAE